MSEAMHPMGAAGGVGGVEPASLAPPIATARETRRPSLVTFAAIMLFLEGGFSVVWAVVAFAQPEWLLNAYSAYGFTTQSGTAWAWGFLDLLVGALAVYAGVSVLRGGAFAQILGFSIAGFSAMRWFFFLPVAPVVAIIIIAIDVLVVYGLATHSEYFATLPLLGAAQDATQEEPLTASSSAPQPSSPFVRSGSLEFSGTVQRVSATSITVRMPDGQTLAMAVIPGRTHLAHFDHDHDHDLPSKGQVIKAHATAQQDGSFTATKLARADRDDQHELAEAEYKGVTTSAVGVDRLLHFQVGTLAFSFPISATADLHDFGNRAQAIGANQPIEVEVAFQGTRGTVVEVERRD